MTDPNRNAKASLRQSLRARRQALSDDQRHALNALICEHALEVLLQKNPSNQAVALYVAHGGEPDLMPVMKALMAAGHGVYLPVLVDQALRFHRFDSKSPMIENRFGILEPSDQPSIEVTDLDWVLMPLVGFASDGTRLGMGGGFYDRTLADLGPTGPIKAGVAYASQQVDALPADAWDVGMDVIISEHGPMWVK